MYRLDLSRPVCGPFEDMFAPQKYVSGMNCDENRVMLWQSPAALFPSEPTNSYFLFTILEKKKKKKKEAVDVMTAGSITT